MAYPVRAGAKELDRLSTIVAIADALGIEPVKLLPAAFTTRHRELCDAVIGTAPDSFGELGDGGRQEMLGVGKRGFES